MFIMDRLVFNMLIHFVLLCFVVVSPYFKYVLLLILVFQNAVLILSMRYSRLVEGECVFSSKLVNLSERLAEDH